MGLDIHLSTDKDKDVYSIEFYRNENAFRKRMSLSREFCNLMCINEYSSDTPEFKQIAEITGVTIDPILDMDKYIDDEGADLLIPVEASEEVKSRMLSKIETERERLRNNIDKVSACLADLIDNLSSIPDLNKKLISYDFDSIGIEYYFSDFASDKGGGYIWQQFWTGSEKF